MVQCKQLKKMSAWTPACIDLPQLTMSCLVNMIDVWMPFSDIAISVN